MCVYTLCIIRCKKRLTLSAYSFQRRFCAWFDKLKSFQHASISAACINFAQESKHFLSNCDFKCGIHKPSILMNPKWMQSMPLSYMLFASIPRTMNHCIYCYRIECRWFTGIVDFNQLTKRTFIRPSYLFWAFQFSFTFTLTIQLSTS